MFSRELLQWMIVTFYELFLSSKETMLVLEIRHISSIIQNVVDALRAC